MYQRGIGPRRERLRPIDRVVVAGELEPTAVGVGGVEAFRPLGVLNGAALKGTEPLCARENVVEAVRIYVERELVGVFVAVVTLGCEEHQQRVPDPNWIVDAIQRFTTGEFEIKAAQRDRIVATKGDVIDAQDSDCLMKS